jgi:superfamily I DNA/RNA helicase
VKVYELKNAKEEARKVVEIIKEKLGEGVPSEEICVMFRAHQYGRIIKKILEEEQIPYVSVAKASLMKQKSVKTAFDYLVILNKLKKKEKGAEKEWWDLVYQLDFKEEDLIRIGRAIKEFNKKPEEGNGCVSVWLLNNLDKLELSESGRLAGKILIEKIKAMIPVLDKSVSEIVKETYRISGLMNEQKTKEEKEIMLNLNRFYEMSKAHEELYDSDLANFIY